MYLFQAERLNLKECVASVNNETIGRQEELRPAWKNLIEIHYISWVLVYRYQLPKINYGVKFNFVDVMVYYIYMQRLDNIALTMFTYLIELIKKNKIG